ncbi:MAG: histidine--tRNA ligase [Gammaproteobacteria bacterium]|nr:histidine--tRNA ligase [Gammaproteobacteria bacterium]
MNIQTVRGMQDLLPEKQEIYTFVTDKIAEVLDSYGYRHVGLPLLESTHLFERTVGEATDIVEKEMYTFEDRGGDRITLRPEGTAGCARLAHQHGLLFNQVQRLWYGGPMFRYERPQKGRYRQFEQIGAECFGMAGPDIDAEIILMQARMWEALGVAGDIELELNSMGTTESRGRYRQALVDYLMPYKSDLDTDSQRRLDTNPLRILDSKEERTRDILESAPALGDYLDEESIVHFDGVRRVLDRQQQGYRINPRIVRGLDYYNKTVFEWVTGTLGSQGTVSGGGRYDGLVEEVGGKPTPAVGFAMGLDRLALMVEERFDHRELADVYIASMGEGARSEALLLAERVREKFANLRVVTHCGDGKFKAQMKRADASGAKVALVLGEDELGRGEVGVKHLREGGQQVDVKTTELDEYLVKVFS